MAQDLHIYNMVENYLYLYHIDKFIILPSYPESIQDNSEIVYNPATPLARSAPIYSYSHSGPRSMQITLQLHRDMFNQINWQNSSFADSIEMGDDYVDTLIKYLEAAALPAYAAAEKMVDPPIVALRFGQDIFIKGVIIGSVGVTYSLPILENDKYAQIQINFAVNEIDPYDAQQVAKIGSFRGLNTSLERKIYKSAGINNPRGNR